MGILINLYIVHTILLHDLQFGLQCRHMRFYTVSHKTCHFILDHNSHASWCIFTTRVSMETGMNTLQRSYKSYNFAPNVSPHYTVKLKPRKTAHFEVNKIVTVYFITQQQE